MQLGMTYQVSKLPFALLIDKDGVLRSKGLVTSREHLESLLESMDSGIASIQEFVSREARQQADGPGEVSQAEANQTQARQAESSLRRWNRHHEHKPDYGTRLVLG